MEASKVIDMVIELEGYDVEKVEPFSESNSHAKVVINIPIHLLLNNERAALNHYNGRSQRISKIIEYKKKRYQNLVIRSIKDKDDHYAVTMEAYKAK